MCENVNFDKDLIAALKNFDLDFPTRGWLLGMFNFEEVVLIKKE